MFLSVYLRRCHQRMAEAGMAALLAFYFAGLFGATPDIAPCFAIAAVIGIASAFFWQFIVLSFDPLRYLRRGVIAFTGSARGVLDRINRPVIGLGDEVGTKTTINRTLASD
jgi:hypothetical protein